MNILHRKETINTDALNIDKQNGNFDESFKENSKEKKSLNLFNNQNRLLNYLILFRIINVICTKTYFNPDEYWQSVEVAHYMIFGYPKLFYCRF